MPEANKDEFARLLHHQLEVRHMSGRELARRLRVNATTAARWRNGENLPEDAETIQRLLDILGVRGKEERQAFYDAAGYLVQDQSQPEPTPQPFLPSVPPNKPNPLHSGLVAPLSSRTPSRLLGVGPWLWSVLFVLAALILIAVFARQQPPVDDAPLLATVPVSTPAPTARVLLQESAAPSTPASSTLCGESARRTAPPANRFLRTEGVSAFTAENTDGLVLSDSVRALAVDARGLWIGYFAPPYGIGHYDGDTWADCTGGLDFPVTKVNALVIDGAGRVWAGTESDGVVMFDGAVWQQFTTANGLPSEGIFGLTVQKGSNGEERVWAATWEGVARFDGDRWSVPYSVHNGTLINNHIHAIDFDAAGNVWIAYVNQGVSQFDGREGRWIHYKRGQGTIGGDEMRVILVRPARSDVGKEEAESVWFASGDGGVTRYTQGVWTVYTTTTGLPSLDVINLALDGYGRVWAATAGGDAFFDGTGWQQRTHLLTKAIAFGPDCTDCPFDADDIWTGTNGSGVTHSGLPLPDPAIDLLGVAVPAVIAPGQHFRPEITVAPRSPYRLEPGDFLAHIDESEAQRFGAHPHLAVTQMVEPGQPFTFIDYDLPFVAPNLPSGETTQIFTSTWRLWMENRYVGPVIPISFTVTTIDQK